MPYKDYSGVMVNINNQANNQAMDSLGTFLTAGLLGGMNSRNKASAGPSGEQRDYYAAQAGLENAKREEQYLKNQALARENQTRRDITALYQPGVAPGASPTINGPMQAPEIVPPAATVPPDLAVANREAASKMMLLPADMQKNIGNLAAMNAAANPGAVPQTNVDQFLVASGMPFQNTPTGAYSKPITLSEGQKAIISPGQQEVMGVGPTVYGREKTFAPKAPPRAKNYSYYDRDTGKVVRGRTADDMTDITSGAPIPQVAQVYAGEGNAEDMAGLPRTIFDSKVPDADKHIGVALASKDVQNMSVDLIQMLDDTTDPATKESPLSGAVGSFIKLTSGIGGQLNSVMSMIGGGKDDYVDSARLDAFTDAAMKEMSQTTSYKEMGDIAAVYHSKLIKMAYYLAGQNNPSGRVSDQDFRKELEGLAAGSFSSTSQSRAVFESKYKAAAEIYKNKENILLRQEVPEARPLPTNPSSLPPPAMFEAAKGDKEATMALIKQYNAAGVKIPPQVLNIIGRK